MSYLTFFFQQEARRRQTLDLPTFYSTLFFNLFTIDLLFFYIVTTEFYGVDHFNQSTFWFSILWQSNFTVSTIFTIRHLGFFNLPTIDHYGVDLFNISIFWVSIFRQSTFMVSTISAFNRLVFDLSDIRPTNNRFVQQIFYLWTIDLSHSSTLSKSTKRFWPFDIRTKVYNPHLRPNLVILHSTGWQLHRLWGRIIKRKAGVALINESFLIHFWNTLHLLWDPFSLENFVREVLVFKMYPALLWGVCLGQWLELKWLTTSLILNRLSYMGSSQVGHCALFTAWSCPWCGHSVKCSCTKFLCSTIV